jgi:predicted small lipoprotein YifL
MQKTRTLWMLAVITVVGMSLSACGQAGGVGPASADRQGNQPAAIQGQGDADDANGEDGDVRNDGGADEADDRGRRVRRQQPGR